MFATTWSKSRVISAGRASFRTGTRVRSASIASFAWSRSRCSSPRLRYPRDETVKTVWTSTSATFSFAYSSSSCVSSSSWERSRWAPPASSATHHLRSMDLLGVDLLERPAFLDPDDLALGRVGRRNRRLDAELVGNRRHPLDQPLELGACGPDLVGGRIDEAAGQAVPDRTPEVLLDHPRRRLWQLLALVARAGDTGSEPVAEGGEGTRLGEVGLGVADPDLDSRIGEVRPDAPPELRVLVDRSRLVQRPDVCLELGPGAVGVGNAAAREHAGEDLGAGGVEAAVDALDDRRACRQREQVREERPQPVVDGDRPVGSPDPDVHVQAEGVVPPDDVAEQLVVPAVVRRVDDALVLPAAPGVCADRAERDPEDGCQRRQLGAALAHPLRDLCETGTRTCADLDLACDQLADEVLVHGGAGGCRLHLLEPVHQRQRLGVEERELLLDRDREVGAAVERIARAPDQLVVGNLLRFPHGSDRV